MTVPPSQWFRDYIPTEADWRALVSTDVVASMLADNSVYQAALPLVAGDRSQMLVRNTQSVLPYDIYSAIFPGVTDYHVFGSVLHIPAGSASENASAMLGVVKEQSGAVNGVALQGIGTAEAATSAVWGVNTLLQDNAARTPVGGSGSRYLIGAEHDFNVMNPATQVIGVSVGGNGLAQPGIANAFIANSLGAGLKWTTAFWSMSGAAQNALAVGTMAPSGVANGASQNVLFLHYDSAGQRQSVILSGQSAGSPGPGFLTASGGAGFKVSYGDLMLDTGHFVIVNGNPVLGARQTGWGPPTGTGPGDRDKTTYVSGYSQAMAGTYSQAQAQALMDYVTGMSKVVQALRDAVYNHGLIGA